MEPAIRSRSSDLPLEILLMILEDAAEPTFSQKEKYDDKNPYATALSLCSVSRLVRRITLPKLLHTILLCRSHSVGMFANALRIQQAYAAEKSDLFFDYTSVIQRMWIGSLKECRSPDSELKSDLSVLVPTLLASPALAVDCSSLRLVVQSVENAWKSHRDPNVEHGPSAFPGKTQSLTITARGHDAEAQIFRSIDTRKGTVFLPSIPHLTYLIDLHPDSAYFGDITMGLISPKYALRCWMRDIPWACMKTLETFSVAYPHLTGTLDVHSYTDHTRGTDLHVERLTIAAPLFKKDPEIFPWGTPPFRKTLPGEKSVRSDGISFKVTNDKGHFWQCNYKWDKAWACGLTDG